jgi:hypothetical protein
MVATVGAGAGTLVLETRALAGSTSAIEWAAAVGLTALSSLYVGRVAATIWPARLRSEADPLAPMLDLDHALFGTAPPLSLPQLVEQSHGGWDGELHPSSGLVGCPEQVPVVDQITVRGHLGQIVQAQNAAQARIGLKQRTAQAHDIRVDRSSRYTEFVVVDNDIGGLVGIIEHDRSPSPASASEYGLYSKLAQFYKKCPVLGNFCRAIFSHSTPRTISLQNRLEFPSVHVAADRVLLYPSRIL